MLHGLIILALATPPHFTDVTDAVGLGAEVVPETVSRLCFADLNGDRWPDVVVDRHRVFLNVADAGSPIGRRFDEVPAERTGLLTPERGTLTVFADLDNDGHLDAIVTESIAAFLPEAEDHGRRSGWQRGRGDGTFDTRQMLPVRPATTSAIAVGDVDRDGRLDLLLGNWYLKYGESLAGFHNDLLLQPRPIDEGQWRVVHLPARPLQEGEPGPKWPEVNPDLDSAGRPTYGVLIADFNADLLPELLELNYGRRWNRLWVNSGGGVPWRSWVDRAPEMGIDSDPIDHGRYPEWLAERARTDPRLAREDEKPFRGNGNTFDAAVADVDNDGDIDVFISEITHAWAGESSDRSRFLSNEFIDTHELSFTTDRDHVVDRIPEGVRVWNQGDLFAALADIDHNGRQDLILSSGDYPDDERLRIFLQRRDRSVYDATEELGLDHDGSQQISLADVDRDGDLDLLAGQTFFRYKPEQKAGRTPQLRLFVNATTQGRKSVVLHLRGDGRGASRDALGTTVRAILSDETMVVTQLTGIGGHAGKQQGFAIHLGLGEAERVSILVVQWPHPDRKMQRFLDVEPGEYELTMGRELVRLQTGGDR